MKAPAKREITVGVHVELGIQFFVHSVGDGESELAFWAWGVVLSDVGNVYLYI